MNDALVWEILKITALLLLGVFVQRFVQWFRFKNFVEKSGMYGPPSEPMLLDEILGEKPGANFQGSEQAFNRMAVSPPFEFEKGDIVALKGEKFVKPYGDDRDNLIDGAVRFEYGMGEVTDIVSFKEDAPPIFSVVFEPVTRRTFHFRTYDLMLVFRPQLIQAGARVCIPLIYRSRKMGAEQNAPQDESVGIVASVDMWNNATVNWVSGEQTTIGTQFLEVIPDETKS